MGSKSNGHSGQGLGNRALLDKVDKLRELGISHLVPLPQMVVVGDQSSGKSSVLESLTGFQFPRAATLCTRHATEIVCRREPTESVVVSIIPHNPSPEREKLVRGFRRSTDKIVSDDFPKIFEDAAKVMGIKLSENDSGGGSAFSLDVLKVEISGPNADHLTVIDVPGMFETVTPGVTTESDIDLVKNMVKRYIEESRTIILAVVPCIVDIANQKILRLAAEADPQGKRTLGVLTKPDLCIENATKAVVCDLVNGKRRDLLLGYCVVKNLGADDVYGNIHSRNQQEQSLFGQAPWNTLPSDRVGIAALQTRIRHLLMDRTRAEFPHVKNEVMQKLKKYQELRADLGESRSTTDQQRAYVGKVASKFTRLKNYGLDAYYTRHEFFSNPETRLITRMRAINEAYAYIMREKGHTREFFIDQKTEAQEPRKRFAEPLDSSLLGNRSLLYRRKVHFKIPRDGEDDLSDLLADSYWCPEPIVGGMLDHIQKQYLGSRGYEIGTFNNEMLPHTFKEQGSKWRPITRAHISNAILIVHQFILQILEESCPDAAVCDELWAFLLDGHDGEDGQEHHEGLLKRYARAMEQVEFLLNLEFQNKTITYNARFEEKFNQLKLDSEEDSLGCLAKSSLEEMGLTIHNVLQAYYDVARDRFVDVVCQQAIDHFLLYADKGPLEVLSDKVVLNMSAELLERIAGEDLAVKEQRERLEKEIESLTQALKILRN
ncbi:hypothetical protein BBK36DRAFT_1170455 [Trichoderma citrinoviride]|uniref:P-loop containing nucleoside triphosphate hydrolase protein n=1 Tax=Trichoderma citrinoviride TaxID=58853 RepID=A0A2T4B622_9HYPO|nr:hypothetical protein BBK36DRAFT_1170455 [Trichoderma citrinoviride]PTB64774.1 hypothetical protein BBK36DRAFT_1170455 [Trichoderma citrinoviride]